jgi:hypothetical protein
MKDDGDNLSSSATSILAGSRASDVATSPFCHVTSQRTVPPDYYDTLQKLFPDDQAILRGRPDAMGNAVARLSSNEILEDPAIAPAWRAFVAFHTSDAFWAEIVRVFGAAMRQTHPDAERKAGKKLEDWRVTRRGETEELEVSLECQFVINTPPSPGQPLSTVKTPHVDKRTTLFAALFYFRDDTDTSNGGDLDLYAWTRRPRFLNLNRMVLPSDIAQERTVPYAPNTFVAFVNSAYSIHGVSPRSAAPVARRYVNFVAEVPFHLFHMPRVGFIDRWIHRRELPHLGSRKIPGDKY